MKNKEYKVTDFLKDCAFFVFAPFVFLIIVSFTGNEIFSSSNGILKKRKVILLSLGTGFYVIILLTILYTSTKV